MSNEELREALEIGMKYAKLRVTMQHRNPLSYVMKENDAVDEEVRKIEAAIASLPTVKDSLTVAPTFADMG